MERNDKEKLIHDYRERFFEYGYSPKTLGGIKASKILDLMF